MKAAAKLNMQICKTESAYLHNAEMPSPIAAPLFELAGVTSPKGNIPERKPRNAGIEIRAGSTVIRIAGRAPGPWYVCWHEIEGGVSVRKRAWRAKFASAKRLADDRANELANGDLFLRSFTAEDKAELKQSREILAPTGKPLVLAVSEYAELVKLLGDVPPAEAVRFYMEHRPRGQEAKRIPEIAVELLAAVKQDGAGSKWLDTLEAELKVFGEKFNCPLHRVQAPALNAWLRTMGGSNSTRKNYRAAAAQLANFAKTAGYLRKDWDEMKRVPTPETGDAEIKVLYPDQMVKMLANCQKSMIPFVAITAFAGIRHEEMNGTKALLDWRDFHWEDKLIYVPEGVAKTVDRIVPMSDNLIAWIQPYARTSGPVVSVSNTSNALTRIKARAGLPHGKGDTRNTLRKSFISYRLALVKNIAQVAEEAGSSPEKVKSNYRKPMPEKTARAWFNIWPTNAEILQLKLKIA
jgi:integrase